MRDLLPRLLAWWEAGEEFGLATVVSTWGSAPRPVGSAMAVGPDGSVIGSVSGGCVEGAVYDLLSPGAAVVPGLHRYGVSDDEAFEVGLSCGGTLEVFVEPVSRATFPQLGELARTVASDLPVTLHTVIDDADPGRVGTNSLGAEPSARRVATLAFAPRPRMLVFGAVDFAAALSRVGDFLGYRVTVCDARPVFATPVRFPAAEVVVDWPHRYLAREAERGAIDGRTAIIVLTHDPKFDEPLLRLALRLPESGHDLGYVGAMGSRRTDRDRLDRLRAAGLSEIELAALHSPIGLDLGGTTPEETAISIVAELIAHRRGGSGTPLTYGGGPIHQDVKEVVGPHAGVGEEESR